MADYNKRIPVTTEGKEVAQAAKRDDESWDEYIRRCAEEPPQTQEFVDVSELDLEGGQLTYSDVVDAVKDALEDARV